MKVLLASEWKVHSELWNGLLMLENFMNEFYMIKTVKLYDKKNNRSTIYEAVGNQIKVTPVIRKRRFQ